MKFAAVILIVALVGAAQAIPAAIFAQAKLQNSLSSIMMNPNDITVSDDPEVTAECFSKYLPMLSEIATTFSTNYQQCITVADQLINDLNAQAAKNRTQFIQQSGDVCSNFQVCDNDTDTLTFFNCYSKVSSDDVNELYELSNNAANAANSLGQGLKTIQDNRDQCTSDAEHTYVMTTAQTYSLLNNCFLNGLPDENTTQEPSVTEPTVDDGSEAPAV